MENLVGAPVDPLFEDDVENFREYMAILEYPFREEFWASYVAIAYMACSDEPGGLQALWNTGVAENWRVNRATSELNSWVEAFEAFLPQYPGFEGTALDERQAIIYAAMVVGYCDYVFDDFMEFIEG